MMFLTDSLPTFTLQSAGAVCHLSYWHLLVATWLRPCPSDTTSPRHIPINDDILLAVAYIWEFCTRYEGVVDMSMIDIDLRWIYGL